MDVDLQRLADTAEALERQAGELREEIRALTEAVREQAEAEERRAGEQAQPVEPAEPGDDSEARLVAYSMVLDGRSREEVASHLADELGMTDADALLDDLYERAAGG